MVDPQREKEQREKQLHPSLPWCSTHSTPTVLHWSGHFSAPHVAQPLAFLKIPPPYKPCNAPHFKQEITFRNPRAKQSSLMKHYAGKLQ